ncbi:FAD-binding oxidoreductase [Streptomyces brasiliensis]|uniref:Glycolate oxidase n=1 Tax=Streptomyces brasiliensis TaxID=1954 RepID=A0A917P6E8_9ACTN|nr:FAD-binding protein [Streptomyces brasiliensis]GGJ63991.1 glycolate oxidase [Streptomyces brasiliensis]
MAISGTELHTCPATPAELRTVLADTVADHPKVRIAGAGTAAEWAAPPAPADLVVDTRALRGIVRYNPADMTVAVRAGTPLADLRRELAAQGQRIAFDAPRADAGATIGGLIATADAGPAQQAYGTLRDLVIGMTIVLADGTVARSGGHVIKNVAGYDLAKLFQGSLGTLGVMAEVVLRLHPLPRAGATLRLARTAAEAVAVGRRVMAGALEPAALEWCRNHLLVRFEGGQEGVEDRLSAAARLAGAPGDVLRDEEEAAAWRPVHEVTLGRPGDTVLRIGTLPGRGSRLIEAADALAARCAVETDATSSVGVGAHTVRLHTGDPAARARFLTTLRAEAAALDALVTVRRREGLPDGTDVWGPPPPTVPLMRAVKQQFDPADRFGAGRLAPWL